MPLTVQLLMEILVCLAALPLLLIAPLIDAWHKYHDHRDQQRDVLRACRHLYGPPPTSPRDDRVDPTTTVVSTSPGSQPPA